MKKTLLILMTLSMVMFGCKKEDLIPTIETRNVNLKSTTSRWSLFINNDTLPYSSMYLLEVGDTFTVVFKNDCMFTNQLICDKMIWEVSVDGVVTEDSTDSFIAVYKDVIK